MITRLITSEESADLRRRVLRPNLPAGTPSRSYPDRARHVGVLDNAGTVLGTCVVFPARCPWQPAAAAWQLRAMAVEPAWQGQGIGGRVLAAATVEVKIGGGDLIWCDARQTAVAFYARHGFIAHGEPFVQAETGLPHLDMWRSLVREPVPAPTSST